MSGATFEHRVVATSESWLPDWKRERGCPVRAKSGRCGKRIQFAVQYSYELPWKKRGAKAHVCLERCRDHALVFAERHGIPLPETRQEAM